MDSFRRQPDRKIGSSEDDIEEDSIPEEISDDDVFFSAEAEEALLGPITDEQPNTPESERNLEKKDSSTDVSDGYNEMAKPQMSNLLHDSSLHSRDENTTLTHQTDQKKKRRNKRKKNKVEETDESPMILDEEDKPDEKEIPKKRKGFSYYPLLTYKRDLDKTFYYKYFRPYSHDYRRLRMEEDCSVHKQNLIAPNVNGMTQTSSTSLKPKVTFQQVKKLHNRRSMIGT